MPCYNVLEFSSCAERDWFQNRMYGTTFVPQFLRGRTSLIARNIRYERKSTGIRFNSQRDLEEFRVALSERFRVNKSVPRCEILPKNWQMMMNKQASFVFMHYQNREDADYAARTYTDDYGAALEYKRGSGPRDNAVVAPATPSRQHTPPPRRSSSGERRDADRERDFSAARDRMRDRPPERDDRHRDGGRQFDPHHRRDDRFDDRRPGMDGRHGDSWGRERDRWHERSQFPSPRRNRDFNAHDHHSQPDWPRDDRNGRFPHRRSRSRSPRNRPMQRERGARPSFGSGRDHGTPYDSNNPGHREHVDRCDDRLDRGHGEPDRPQDRESEPRNSQNNEDIQDIEQQKEHGVGRGHDVGHDDPRQEQSTTVHDTKSDEGLGILKHMPAEDGSTQAALNSGNGRDIASNVKDESEADASDRHGTNNLPPNSTDARTEVPHGTTSENKDGNTEREQARTHDGDLDRVPEHHGDRTSQAKSHREDVLNDEHRDPVDQKEIRDSHPPGCGRSEPGELNDRDRYRHVDMDRRHNDDRVEQRRAERSDHLHRYGHRDSVDERRPDHDERDRREQWDDHERFHRYEQPDHSRRGYHDTDPRGPHERDIHDRHDRLEPREWERHGEDISKEPPHHRSRSRSRSRSRGGPRRGASPQGFSNGGHDGGRRRGKFRGHYRQKPRGRYGP
ncbi:TPA: hypothetical protein N0F65_000989 [Lagenidium giganteum]|uniref:Uncharacterized protein n=1 Tax=Lagenidium giganteum TaxID=4803 RepID=A0AAV2YZP1_9STRA|nr:TPA: hypothetical protein N0F65_000989 [Lagenidium giganteum]